MEQHSEAESDCVTVGSDRGVISSVFNSKGNEHESSDEFGRLSYSEESLKKINL